ncbi:hypothetical protein ACWDFH_31580 [Streptomyces kronopolitis]
MLPRTALLLAASVPVMATAAAVALRAGRWELYVDRHRIEITARPRSNCPRWHGEGGWWVGGAFPEMEACPCWADRRELRIRLLLVPTWDEPPF